jgi:hypothetical protein
MELEQSDIDIDNFIKEKISARYFKRLNIEPSPDFSRRTMERIYRLKKRRDFLILCEQTILLIFGPLSLRQLWLLVRNDYFAAAHLPLGNLIVKAYQIFLSWTGVFLLLAIGIGASIFVNFKSRRNELNPSSESPKIA